MSKLVILTLELPEAKALLKELQRVPLAIGQTAFGEGLRKFETGVRKAEGKVQEWVWSEK